MVQLIWKWSRISTRWEVQRQAISVGECGRSSQGCDIRLVYNEQVANEITRSYRSVQSILKDVCVCVCVSARACRKFVTACFATSPPHHHSFSWQNKLQLSTTIVFYRSCTVQSFGFSWDSALGLQAFILHPLKKCNRTQQ